MGCYASKVIEIAKSEVGYKETPVNKTKYAEFFDKEHPDFYNYKKQGVAWCDIFVDYCFVSAFGEEDAMRLLCQPKKSAGAGCVYSYGYFKKKGQTGDIPKVGSQIFFGNGTEKSINHTGLVVDVKDGRVYTIEGNSDNAVKERNYAVNSSKIFGYGYPAYDNEPSDADNSHENGANNASKPADDNFTEPASKPVNEAIILQVINGLYGNGNDREKRLEAEGYNYQEVQSAVNAYLKGKTATKKTLEVFNCPHGLRLRSRKIDGAVLLIMMNGTPVTELSREGEWSFVQYKTIKGYACNRYLK